LLPFACIDAVLSCIIWGITCPLHAVDEHVFHYPKGNPPRSEMDYESIQRLWYTYSVITKDQTPCPHSSSLHQ
jgi:hypothetical protein